MHLIIKRFSFFILLSFFLFILSCRSENKLLEKEDLFVIPMGVLADELDYFYRSGSLLPGVSDLFIREGRIYLTSSNMGKIMEMNSYGDLLSLVYNPQTNPEPANYLKQDDKEESLIRIRKWNFRNLEHVAVDEKWLLVVDQLGEDLPSSDGQTLYNRIILRFDKEGRYIDSLGQEGINGTPFSFVQDLQITGNGDIVVMTHSVSDTRIFWFSGEGQLLYKVILDKDHLPDIGEEGWTVGQVEKIAADFSEYKLYLKMDFFPLNDLPDLSFASRLYTLDLRKEEYTSFFDIPRFSISMGEDEIEGVNEYLGMVAGGLHYFLGSYYNGKYHLTIMDRGGAVKTSRVLNINDQNIIYKKLFISPDGLLAGIFYEETGARISWWRADRIAEKYAEN